MSNQIVNTEMSDERRVIGAGTRMARLIRPAIRLDQPSQHILWPLFIVSCASLYLEITLIRWLGTEVGIFAFFQNLTLIACFLGFGLGCYWSRQKRNLFSSLKALAILIVLAARPSPAGSRKTFPLLSA